MSLRGAIAAAICSFLWKLQIATPIKSARNDIVFIVWGPASFDGPLILALKKSRNINLL